MLTFPIALRGGEADVTPIMRWLGEGWRRLAGTIAMLPLALALLVTQGLADDTRDKILDQLFAQLRLAPNPRVAHDIDQRIWSYWTTPENPDLASRMAEALEARALGDMVRVIQLLTGIIADYPTYAEAWNQRATMYYLLNDFEASLADIEKVLQYEPRHFGALSGRALIYLQQGKRTLAIRDMAAALALHPFLDERQLFPELFRDVTRI